MTPSHVRCRRPAIAVLVLSTVVAFGGCSGPDDAPTPTAGDAKPSRTPPDMTGVELTTGPKGQASAARRDLAAKLGVAESDITMVEARNVTWPSSATGCEMPDRGYLDVITRGTLVRMRAAGREYVYTGGPVGALRLCEAPGRVQKPVPGGGLDET